MTVEGGTVVPRSQISLGVEPMELPLSPPKIWALVRKAKTRRAG